MDSQDIRTEHARRVVQALADEIQAELAAQRLRHSDLADLTGFSTVTIGRYLNVASSKREMGVRFLYLAAQALGVDPRDLISRAIRRADARAHAYPQDADVIDLPLVAKVNPDAEREEEERF